MTKHTLLSRSIRSILMAGVGSAFLASAPGFAQEAQDIEVSEVESTTTEQAAKEAKEEKAERIQVTGSRIRSDSFASEIPIDIISAEEATAQGITTLGELLRTSTVAAGSDQITSALSNGYVTNGGVGAETISMRGLGAGRTLILLNGRRAGPAGTRGAVSSFDMSALPVSAIERVEILKDGASSLYGSDAVAGVINFITKKGDEKTISVDVNQPFESGGERRRINFSIGESFDRGSVRVVGDYTVQKELQRGDRDFYACSERLYYNQDGSRADPIDPRTGKYNCNDTGYGLWLSNAGATNFPLFGDGNSSARGMYDYDGFMAANGYQAINDTWTQDGDLRGGSLNNYYFARYDKESDGLYHTQHPFTDKETMIPETKTAALFVQGDYMLTDDISAFGEFMYSSRSTETNGYRQFWTGDVGYLPASYHGAEGNTYIMPVALTDHYGNDVTVDYTRFVAGLEGTLGFWDWNVSYQNSHNKGEYKSKVIFRDSMLMAQQHLVDGTSCSGESTEFSGKTCVDVNWLDPMLLYGSPSDEVRNFLFGYDKGETTYKQQTLEGFISGDLFDLPAGTVGLAVGASYQTDKIDDQPGENSSNGNSWGLTSASRTVGDQNQRAIFGEVRVPILSDLPMVENLALTASGRWTDVSTYGSDTTFKVGLSWQINEMFTIRGSRGTSFRSPALYELYLAGQTGFSGQTADPCYDYGAEYEAGNVSEAVYANCQADGVPLDYDGTGTSSIEVRTSGGAETGLEAETSVAEGLGFVFTSPENTFAFSMDYYDIVISGQIASLSASNILGTCYRSQDFANEPLCNLFTRNDGTNGNYGIERVNAGYVNVATQTARGIDFNFTYKDEFSFGDVRLVWEHTNQIETKYQLFADSDPNNYVGEIGYPKHVGRLAATFSKEDWSVTWTMNYFDKTNDYEYYNDSNETTYRGEDVTFVAETPFTVYHTVSGNMTFEDFNVTLGIANLFDKEPAMVSPSAVRATGNAVLYSQYDNLGRRAFANITYTF